MDEAAIHKQIRDLEAEIERLQGRVAAVLAEWTRPSAIRLMAGEMTAQEMRTAQAVINGLAAKVRRAIERT